MSHRPDLPGVLSEIAAAAGDEAAQRLATMRGGTEIFIPRSPEGSVLAEIVGIDAATRIIAALGAGRLMLPAGSWRGAGGRKRRGIAMLKDGASLQEVALETGVDRRTVSRWREEISDGGDQFSLRFDS